MMKTPLSAVIARRYLFAPKSHSAVTAISVTATVGIAVATAAIVCVLSVFNGFKSLLTEKLDTLAPDVIITPAAGKTFADTDSLLEVVRGVKGVAIATPTVADNALLICDGREMPVLLKGVVPEDYRRITAIDTITLEGGRFATREKDTAPKMVYDSDIGDYVELPAAPKYLADIAIGVSTRLYASPQNPKMIVFAPRRRGHVNTANPSTSFVQDSLKVAGVFQAMQNDYDDNYVITDIELARDIFQYTTECTAVEVKGDGTVPLAALAASLQQKLGDGNALVRDRFRQQALNFRMISIEKWVSFLLLAFILVVASFNIISSLSMLILDKQGSLGTLHALGLSKRRIGAIFAWQSFYVTLIGATGGVLLGVALCLLQQHFGLIKLAGDPSTLVVKSYPVKVIFTDLLAVYVPVLIIGAATALISSRFARSRVSSARL